MQPDPERRAFWHERYAAGAAWSGHVNPVVEETASRLVPGTAVDLGCGEGGDVLWLAEHGWRATGLDAAAPALARGRDEALRRGVADRAEFVETDLGTWDPEPVWDLVTCHYLHEAADLRSAVLAAAVGAVAPGGTLIVVGHHPDEPAHLAGPRGHTRFLAEDLVEAAGLGDGWQVTTRARPRTSVRDGVTVERVDTVLVATAPAR
ncbi:SAM-dependent methyltransferase [Demequina salsinemoris]|uniref:SAM-dependent methyltransferase n=1 Tax=Demequina salsinemoris TaxID=577470 RepID=UPI000782B16C|nr:class I SAM-dependent methyltransferase [Demequina salsinemoris]